jgi:EAL domain-containing protein (putative c-di-GMP-specific phosphodiesterase class I)
MTPPGGYIGRILAPGGLRVAFQPILRWQAGAWNLLGFEGLVRGPAGTNLEDAEILFEYVRRKRAEALVDRHCIQEILKAAPAFGPSVRLTANVHAATVEQDPAFPEFVERVRDAYQVEPSRLTIEIVEHSPSRCGDRVIDGLGRLRNLGFPIALDDVGLGYANFRMMLDVRPDCFKIDRYIVRDAHLDYHRRAVVRSIVQLADSFGAYAVAEGIDDVDDLAAVLDEGVHACQGYLFARPAAAPRFGNWEAACSAARRLPLTVESWGSAGQEDRLFLGCDRLGTNGGVAA